MLLSEDEIRAAIAAAFTRPQRVQTVMIRDWQLTVVVNCDHNFGAIAVSELVKLAEGLLVPLDQVTVWDLAPNTLEISIDCDFPTPIERPRKEP